MGKIAAFFPGSALAMRHRMTRKHLFALLALIAAAGCTASTRSTQDSDDEEEEDTTRRQKKEAGSNEEEEEKKKKEEPKPDASDVPDARTEPAVDASIPDANPDVSTTCDTTGVDVLLGPIGSETARTLSFTGAPTNLRYFQGSTCPTQYVSTTTRRPYRALVVQNTTQQQVTLSTWAVCDAKTDAFIAAFKGTKIPASNAELKACTGQVANGASGSGGNTSPEANGSKYCPGLLRSKNAGITLGACEKIVVYVQPFWELTGVDGGAPIGTPPSAIRFRVE
jgi:hypothetical protein